GFRQADGDLRPEPFTSLDGFAVDTGERGLDAWAILLVSGTMEMYPVAQFDRHQASCNAESPPNVSGLRNGGVSRSSAAATAARMSLAVSFGFSASWFRL
ncbi:hypothetical protein GS421_07485, partial [Rhodococcus hoagii]|nr:hypothetical protein [Prescottella equi]